MIEYDDPHRAAYRGHFAGIEGSNLARSGPRGAPNRADPRRRLDADVDRRRRFQFFGLSSVQLEDAPGRYWPLELVEELSGRIDLGVMLAVREDAHLVEVFGKPGARTLSGIRATVGEDRIVEMTVEDANCLIPVGWTLLT
jgi:hypothetical protein